METAQFGLSEARRIYKAEGIKLHYWPLSYKIKAMYMCGAACHPGGGVNGVAGHNAAREVLADLGKAFPASKRL